MVDCIHVGPTVVNSFFSKAINTSIDGLWFSQALPLQSVNKYNPFADWRLKVNSSAMLLCCAIVIVTVHAQISRTSWSELPSC